MINDACFDCARGLKVITADDPVSDDLRDLKVAIQVHVYFDDLLPELTAYVGEIPCDVDCYISTDTKEKETRSAEAFSALNNVRKVHASLYENRGRDVAPFLAQLAPVIDEYDLICHIHTKKSETVRFGDRWRRFLFDHLFGSREYTARLLSLFCEDAELGIVMPESYPVIQSGLLWSGAREDVARLIEDMDLRCLLPEEHPVFPAGDMFWARTEAVAPLFKLGINASSFPDEAGQTNQTLAHAVERVWCYLAQARGFKTERVFNAVDDQVVSQDAHRLALFVHFDISKTISPFDLAYLKGLKKVASDVVVISNGGLDEASQRAMAPYVSEVIVRDNAGYDFGAWNHALHQIGRDALSMYQELILCNNSCIGPVRDFSMMFDKMAGSDLDFWGITLFPAQRTESVEGAAEASRDVVPEHLQSYFIVFTNDVFCSDAFWEFWDGYQGSNGYFETVLKGESQLTRHLAEGGYRYGAYLPESLDIGEWLGTEQPQNELGIEYVLLGSPLIKKKNDFFLTDSRRENLNKLLESLSCEPCLLEYFAGKKNEHLSTLEKRATSVQEQWRKEPPPKHRAPSVENQFWYVVEDYTVGFSGEGCGGDSLDGTITLNWLIPPISEDPTRHALLFKIMSGLEARGFHSTMCLYGDASVASDAKFQAVLEKRGISIAPSIGIHFDVSSLGFSHLTIATEWQNAFFLQRFNDTLGKLYLMQDFEPLLPACGSVSEFVEQAYSFGLHPITAGSWVKEMMVGRCGIDCDWFSYGVDHDVFRPRMRRSQKKRVLFHAAPSCSTHDFELGVLAISEVCKRRSDVSVELIGEDVSRYVIPFKHNNHGALPPLERAKLYSECDLSIFLSSTNLSPLTVEAMACGSVVMCADGDGSRWLAGADAVVFTPYDPIKMADVIDRCLSDRASMDEVRRAGIAFAAKASWETEIDKVADALRRIYQNARID